MSKLLDKPEVLKANAIARKAVDECHAIIDAAVNAKSFGGEKLMRSAIGYWLFAENRDRSLRERHLSGVLDSTVAVTVQVVMADKAELGSLQHDMDMVRSIAMAKWKRKRGKRA